MGLVMMKKILILSIIAMMSVTLFSSQLVNASSPLDLTGVNNFAILANTYTNADATTVLHGDLGYRVPPTPTPPTVTGATIAFPDPAYIAAETKQATLIANANAEACTLTITQATVLDGMSPIAPGVYCFTGAVSINSVVTLDGPGQHIFIIGGALNTVAGSKVKLTGGAKSDDVFWVPVGGTTLGAESTFAGNLMSDAAITLLDHVTMKGRILSDGAVTTGMSDKIMPSKGDDTIQSIPDFPFSFSLVIMFVAVAAVYMGVRQKMIPGFKSF